MRAVSNGEGSWVAWLPFVVISMLLVVAAAACGDDGGDSGQPLPSPRVGGQGGGDGATRIEIRADDLKFDKDRISTPANTQVTVMIDNQDEGVLHNFSVYRSANAQQQIHMGQLFQGPATREEAFRTPEPGSYFFRCDAHPDAMNGAFVVQ
jgi:hypothetical protein